MASDMKPRNDECQFIRDRINSVEDCMSDLCNHFSAYTHKTAHLRDDGDKLAKTISNYASRELLNVTLQSSLLKFCDILCAVQDYRDTEVQRLHHKVVIELSAYSHICKQAKEELKKHLAVLSNEESRVKQSLKNKEQNAPSDRSMIERGSTKPRTEAEKAGYKLMKLVDTFERKKLDDLKRIFSDFIQIELLFHTRAVELYSRAYSEINRISIEEDMEEFRSRFRFPCFAPCSSLTESLSHKPFDDINETSLAHTERDNRNKPRSCDEMLPKSSHPNNVSSRAKKNVAAKSDSSSQSSLSENGDAAKAYHSFKWKY